jgi:hypothetical protein
VVPVTRADFPFSRRVFRFEHPESDWHRLGRLAANGLADAVHSLAGHRPFIGARS